MKLTALVSAAALSVIASFGCTIGAYAQSDCKTLVKASPFGPDDETGATNRVTPAVIKAFVHEYRIKFPVGLDLPSPDGPIPQTMESYRMRGTPSIVLIDRHGYIRKHSFGAVDDLRLGAEIGALTQEHSAAASMNRSSAA